MGLGGGMMKKIKIIGLLTISMSLYLLLFSHFAIGATNQNNKIMESAQVQTDSMNTIPVVPGEIVDLTLSEYNVAVGDKVTAKVWGAGTCLSWVGTSGADGSEGLSDLYVDQSPLPHYYTFTVEKAGTFTIGVMGLKPDQTGCIAAEQGSIIITTTLTVSSAEDILKEKATKPQFEQNQPGPPPVVEKNTEGIFGGQSQLPLMKPGTATPRQDKFQQSVVRLRQHAGNKEISVGIPGINNEHDTPKPPKPFSTTVEGKGDTSHSPKVILPDLTVTGKTFDVRSFSNSEGLTCYDIRPRFTISNIGTLPVESFHTKIEKISPDPRNNWEWGGSFHVGKKLHPGESRYYNRENEPYTQDTIRWCSTETGWKPAWRITVDYTDWRKESNEGNNVLELTFRLDTQYSQVPELGFGWKAEPMDYPLIGPGKNKPFIPGTVNGFNISDTIVNVGDLVTVNVLGSGTCLTWVGTNGADGEPISPLISQAPLPHTYAFTAKVPGVYKVVLTSALRPDETACYNEPVLNYSALLTIRHPEKPTKAQKKDPKNLVLIPNPQPGPPPVTDKQEGIHLENEQRIAGMKPMSSKTNEYPNLVFAKASAVCNKKTRTLNIGLTPRNTGKTSAGPFAMDVKIGGKKVKSFNYTDLKSGATGRAKRLFYQFSQKEAEGILVEAQIDPGKRVRESNDYDNTKRWRISCMPKGKLSINGGARLVPKFRISLSTSDSSLKVGQNAKVKVKVTNVGKGVGPNTISYSLSHSSPFKAKNGKFSAPKPNETKTFFLTGKMTSQGSYKISLNTRYGKSNTLSLKVAPRGSRSFSRRDNSRLTIASGSGRNANRSDTRLAADRTR